MTDILEEKQTYADAFREFIKLHNNELYSDYCGYLLGHLQESDISTKKSLIKILSTLELHLHQGNNEEVLWCQKMHFKRRFLPYKPPSCVKSFTQKLVNHFRKHSLYAYTKYLLILIRKLFTYYADVYKDFYILTEYAKYFAWAEYSQNVFGLNILILMIFSLVVPTGLNIVRTAVSNVYTFSGQSLLCLLIISPALPAVLIYSLTKVDFIAERAAFWNLRGKNGRSHNEGHSTAHQAWSKLLVNLKANENATEQIIQVFIIFFLMAIKFSGSSTSATKLEELFVGDDTAWLALSAIWSVISIILGHLMILNQGSIL
jgi:hypothetical protein